MEVKQNVLRNYINETPLALAFERTIESRIYKTLPLNRPILDLGCGEGLFAKLVFSEPIDTGLDPNPKELEKARENGGYKELMLCEGASIPKGNASYNTVISNSVLEHIENLEPVLKEVHRVLAPGGRFYFTVPSELFDHYSVIFQMLSSLGLSSLAEKYRAFFNRFWRHYHYYTLQKWEELARQAGFEVVESYTYNPKFLCLLNDFLAPFAFPQFIVKRFTNRWILFPLLRRFLSYPAYVLGGLLLKNGEKAEKGGLAFVALTKRS